MASVQTCVLGSCTVVEGLCTFKDHSNYCLTLVIETS
jgi:hypothetical protein